VRVHVEQSVGPDRDAERTRGALAALGTPLNVRAEALSPRELVTIAEALA